MVITEKVEDSNIVIARNEFADIKGGSYAGRRIAVKTIWLSRRDDLLKIRKVSVNLGHQRCGLNHSPQRFCKEAVLWDKLSHPNVMKLVGVLGGIEKCRLSTVVSEWMMHGDIIKYIEKNYAHRLELVRDSAFPAASSATMCNSCTGQPKV